MTQVTILSEISREELMKSLYDSRPEAPCPLCGLPWARGAPISKWLGKWSHDACKAVRMAAMAPEGQRSTLPDARGWADRPDTLIKTKNKGKNFRSKVM